NAGYTGNWWGVVADASGQNPIQQGPTDPYPGMYVSTTSLVNSNYAIPNPLRYVNSETVPFIAIPTNVLASGNIIVGDVAYVYNTTTGQSCFAIYADAGNTTSIGEASIMTASLVGVDPDVRTGGTSQGIIDYVVFPHSGFGQGYIPTIAQIDSIGNLMLATVGGPCIASCIGPVYNNQPPSTAVNTPAGWDTTSFTATFSDINNGCSAGIEKTFYQVSDYNTNNEWRANNANGFFNDDFNGSAISPGWTSVAGTWAISGNALYESDENSSNTNIYAPLAQNLSDCYLYEWTGTMDGSGNNRRAGFHFFCDQPDSSNRGNSYFVWFRLDDDKIQIYKVINNSWGNNPVLDTAYNFTANQSYDFKVMYDRISGVIRVYVNDVSCAQWVDSLPIANGSYVSFRNGNCNYKVDNFKVFRSRSSSALVSAGTGNGNDIRFENHDPATPAGRISSVVTDRMRGISAVSDQYVNTDFTHPSSPLAVNDGTASDIDTTFNGTQLEANWSACADPNSHIRAYYFAIGTTPGASDVIPWTSNGINTSVTVTGLTLMHQQQYYFSVLSEDSAMMQSAVTVSDGQLYFDVTTEAGLHSADNSQPPLLYPNPSPGVFTIGGTFSGDFSMTVFSQDGKMVMNETREENERNVDISSQPDGIYFVRITAGGKTHLQKVVKAE
ncbi:MAG TPA: T9SS type A sorting domain-containing protein, partial [Bacteroidia bacterium]|nr:T9SS type A sorting domain-containing protein [Bacteroidia bacterium]